MSDILAAKLLKLIEQYQHGTPDQKATTEILAHVRGALVTGQSADLLARIRRCQPVPPVMEIEEAICL
jgi:hypothetical protein